MTLSKNNTSPTKVVSLRLPIEEYENYASEASDLGLDLSPHLMEKLKWYDEIQLEKEALENTFFDITREKDKLYEEQVKLKAEIQSLKLGISTLRSTSESIKSTADLILKLERDKSAKSHREYALLLEKNDEIISANEKEITNLKQEKVATMKKMEAVINDVIDKAHDFYLDAPVFSKMNLTIFEKPLKKIYVEAFPQPESRYESLFGLSARFMEELKKNV